MNAPDVAPLSIADSVVSDIKGIVRVDQAFQRSVGQGIAAQTVSHLDQAVVAAAKQAGPDVFKALMEGRAATVNKYKASGVFDMLRQEPVQVVNQLTAQRDSAVRLLSEVKRTAPAELPKVGRAVLDGLLQKATAEGSFNHGAALYQDWQRLGRGTKGMLFPSPGHVQALDDFFLLAKRMADNPNPSGTALTLTSGGELGLLFSNPAMGIPASLSATAVSALLHNPRAVRVIVRGMRIPGGARTAGATVAAELTKLAHESRAPLVPVTVETEP